MQWYLELESLVFYFVNINMFINFLLQKETLSFLIQGIIILAPNYYKY